LICPYNELYSFCPKRRIVHCMDKSMRRRRT
jgi:hypothetical protein